MDWNQLLSRQRLGATTPSIASISRTDFQRDVDRIVFSSAFRRMQDKTQVFPLAKSDYVRTRLTHSLETSSVGRSLGTLVGEHIIARHHLIGFEASDFGDICAAACLAHDIGNPPFSHAGEDAIRHWATHGMYGRERVALLLAPQRADFLHFEGNAQGFRILTRLQNRENVGGLQLTCATLGAFTKYPRAAALNTDSIPNIHVPKHGFFTADHGTFIELAKTLGLLPQNGGWCRHPLAFLVEAADDICYRVIDIEDGFRLGHLDFQTARDLYEAILHKTPHCIKRAADISSQRAQIEFLRAKAINEVIQQTRDCFLDVEPQLLAGSFHAPLITQVPSHVALERLLTVAGERIYCAPEVVEIEIAGFEVLSELLDRFSQVFDDLAMNGPAATPKSRMIRLLVPEHFIGAAQHVDPDPYVRLLNLTDFLAGMTDSYAVNVYKKLTGISLPGG